MRFTIIALETIALGILLWFTGDLVDENQALRAELKAVKPCPVVAAEQCMAFWFSGDATAPFKEHKRVCGKKK